MISNAGKQTHVVIVGGGAAALEAKYAIRDLGGDQVFVEVLTMDRVISCDREKHRLLLLDRTELEYDFLVAAVSHRTGRRIVGLPFDDHQTIPVDHFGLIDGCEREYAAGDATSPPVKFQGTTAEHADVVAAAIATEAEWNSVRPTPSMTPPVARSRSRQLLQVSKSEPARFS
jgi:NADPH-dependent 2,4-dienoyl-CoA reductase/sulfur reductase-like enzyme